MSKMTWTLLFVFLSTSLAIAEDQKTNSANDESEKPKTLSGMSILGNEEAPKSLVIVPWKSAEIGEDVSLTETLDDRPMPVYKEVFLRELRFYEIRSNEK